MALTPEQQEEFDALKKWWKENGVMIIATFAITAAALFGWKSWQSYQMAKKEKASMAFEALSIIPDGQTEEPALDTSKIEQYIKNFEASDYASLAALLAAKAYVEKEDYANAAIKLRWVVDHSDKKQIKEIAQLRLARVLLAQGENDAALKVVNGAHDIAFAGFFAEIRGDILLAMGQSEEARNHYEEAANHAEVDLSLLKLKINAAGGRLN